MPERDLISAAEVAVKLGHAVDWFYRRRDRLERTLGFPPCVAGCGKRWDPEAIDRWLDVQMPAELRSTGVRDDGPWPRRLDARAVALAARLAPHVGEEGRSRLTTTRRR